MKFQISSLLALTTYIALALIWSQIGLTFLLVVTPVSLLLVVVGYARWPLKIPKFVRRIASINLLIAFFLLATIGPATRMAGFDYNSGKAYGLAIPYERVYRPVTDSLTFMPDAIQPMMRHYINIWLPKGTSVVRTWPNQMGWIWKHSKTMGSRTFNYHTASHLPRESDKRGLSPDVIMSKPTITSPAVPSLVGAQDGEVGS